MSLIVTVCTSEGIVMASDSRSSLTKTNVIGENNYIEIGAHYSDSTYKTFLCDNKIGISTCGNGTICGKSIASHIENFINNVYDARDSLEIFVQKFHKYFFDFKHNDAVIFHVAGYEKTAGVDAFKVYRLNTRIDKFQLVINNSCGAQWDGESAILSRLVKNGYIVDDNEVINAKSVEVKNDDGTESETTEQINDCIIIPAYSQRHEELEIAWGFMTLQDGIDFAQYAIKTTIDTMRFQVAPKTVGGPIDVLVIKPNGAIWIAHKELHA